MTSHRKPLSKGLRSPSAKHLVLFLLVTFCASPLLASFFMRLRSSASNLLKATGGRVVYDAKASVNGRDASIAVLGFDRPLRETASSARSFWNLPPLEAGTAPDIDGAWITKTSDGIQQTLLLMPGNSADTCSAWLVETEAKNAETPPPPPPGGNPLPTADLQSWIENQTSHTLLTVHETTETPAGCIEEASARLVADGWAAVFTGPSCALFSNGDKTGAVAAFPGPRTGITRAVVIRQR